MHAFFTWESCRCPSSHKSKFCEWHNKDFELKQEAVMGRISGPPQFSAVNWFLLNSWKRGWRSVLCFLSSLLIPYSSGRRESCLHIHNSVGNGATPPALFCPLSTLSCRAWLILCLVMVGRLQAFSKPFAGWTSKLQGYSDLRRWEKMRSTASKDCEGFTWAFSCAVPEVNFVLGSAMDVSEDQ